MGQAAPFSFRMRIGRAGPTPPIPNRMILRRDIEDQIERLIATLDELDGDTADNEPSLGWTTAGALGAHDDREEDDDAEASLGRTVSGHVGRPSWPGEEDCELDTSDDEPSLGWTAAGALGVADDREDDEDSGFADIAALESEDRDHQSFRSGITPRQRAAIDALVCHARLSNDCPREPARRPR